MASAVGLFLLSFAGSAATGALLGMPVPRVHDEFSYLLAGDTFARLRLTNTAHPFWEHFESFHIVQVPTYMSKYPPGQGFMLALGYVFGHPIVGVWISAALMCASVFWMLVAWTTSRWAVVGGLLTWALYGFVGYWAQSYWGGAVAATGAALVYGALRRITRRPRVRGAVVFGIGLLVLALSRPWEGLVVASPALALLAVWIVRQPRTERFALGRRIVLPLGFVGLTGIALLGTYNVAVSGSVTRPPYQVYEREYSGSPTLIWESRRELPEHRHERLADAYRTEFRSYGSPGVDRYATVVDFLVSGPGSGFGKRPWPILLLPLLFVPAALIGSSWLQYAAGVILLGILSTNLVYPYGPQYLAPLVPLVMLLGTEGLRRLRLTFRRQMFFRQLIVPGFLLTMLVGAYPAADGHYSLYSNSSGWWMVRQAVSDSLASLDEDFVIFVQYGDDYPIGSEWVYNSAAIDEQDVVWARDMGDSANRSLADYFGDREVLFLKLCRSEPVLLCTRQPQRKERWGSPAAGGSSSDRQVSGCRALR